MIDLRAAPRSAFSWALENNMRRLGPIHKVRSHFLGAVRLYLEADSTWLYRRLRYNRRLNEMYFDGDEGLCDQELLEPFARLERPTIPRNVLLAPLRVHDRLVGVVGAAKRDRNFAVGTGRALNRFTALLGKELSLRQDERLAKVLDRIKEKVISELRPRDLVYQILDGLYELVHYDHSAALLTYQQEPAVFRVEAEKIVWTKTKSGFVGHEIPARSELLQLLHDKNLATLFDKDRPDLYELLDYHRGHGIPRPTSILCAPLFVEDELLGLLKIVGMERLPFDRRDRDVVERFLPAAAVSLRNVHLKQSLEDQAMQAEMRASLVTLARAVAHDVNNAIGSILPLADQAREDLQEGQVDPEGLVQDLDVIIEKAALCKRIFANMLKAGSERAGAGPVDLNQLVREALPMLEAQAAPRSIVVEVDLADELPTVRFSKSHLERILWNLATNAIEAMNNAGGRVVITTRSIDGAKALLSVADDGTGIPPEIMHQVQEPFFTTKRKGTGLGLSLCRAMAWQYGGNLEIESSPAKGTKVRVTLPFDEATHE
jgi:signal transduction histidine kinase